MSSPLSSDEKFWAILSHLAALGGGLGILIPTYGWVENRKKSAYAAFQSLQALSYQSLGYAVWAVAYLLVVIISVLVTLPVLQTGDKAPASIGLWLGLHAALSLVIYAVYLFFPLAGAVRCALGHDFRYPWLGNRLARFLAFDPGSPERPLDEPNEDRVAIAMGHFCVIFPLWGLFVPTALLTTQGSRSRLLKFQSIQIIVFQAVGTLVTLALGLIAFAVLFAALLPIMLGQGLAQLPMQSMFGAILFLFCFGMLILVVPLFQLIGQWAGLRVLLGHDYRYPLIGRMVERWLSKRDGQTPAEANP